MGLIKGTKTTINTAQTSLIPRARLQRLAIAIVLSGILFTYAPVIASAMPIEANASVIKTITGSLAQNAKEDTQDLVIKDSEAVAGPRGFILVAIRTHGVDSLDPGNIHVNLASSKRDNGGDLMLVSRKDTLDSKDSYAVVKLKLNAQYKVKFGAEHQTYGNYVATITLAGDVNNDGQVNADDIAAIKNASNHRSGKKIYVPAADIDMNGENTSHDVELAQCNVGASVNLINPLDTFLGTDALTLTGVDVSNVNDIASPMIFHLTSTTFSNAPEDTTVHIDGVAVDPTNITISSNAVTVQNSLHDGKNTISFDSVDQEGRTLHMEAVVWAGQGQLIVRLVDEAGQTFTQSTSVHLALADDNSVGTTMTTSTGSVIFANLPNRTMIINATTAGNIGGSGGGVLSDGTVTIKMHSFGTPSTINNNDFSQGLAGWDIGNAPVSIIDHVDSPGPAPAAANTSPTLYATQPRTKASSNVNSPMLKAQAEPTNPDLELLTSGQGEQSISRTFNTDPGVSSVTLRYRFVTSEVPGGFFGTQFNDYFSVSLRSQQAGGQASELNSMNGLGLAAFDGQGSTGWRDVTLPTNTQGDTIAINLAVANVADGLFDSVLVVDFVQQANVRVMPKLNWNSTSGGLDVSYSVQGGTLTTARTLTVNFASGTTYASRLGTAVFTQNIPANTQVGTYGPFHINGNQLANDPPGTTSLVAATNETDYGSIPDVRIQFGPNANASVVAASMIHAIKDGLRAAGQAQATITSSARTPADQARAMFQNLTNPAHTIQQNISNQHNLYAAAGDAVIDVFANAVAGMTPAQIQANATQIKQAMVDEINKLGCQNVSKHCADPAVLSVVDVSAAAFNSTNGPLFTAAVIAQGAHLIDERKTNGCYHFELKP